MNPMYVIGNRISAVKALLECKMKPEMVLAVPGSPVSKFSSENQIPVREFGSSAELEDILSNLGEGIYVSTGCPYKISIELIDSKTKEFINCHPSLLPKYPGKHAITEAIYMGGPYGVTIHGMDQEIDSGRLIMQKELNFEDHHDTLFIFKQHFHAEEVLFKEFLENLNRTGKVDYREELSRSKHTKFVRDLTFRKISPNLNDDDLNAKLKALDLPNHYPVVECGEFLIEVSKSAVDTPAVEQKNISSEVQLFITRNNLRIVGIIRK